MSIYDLLAEKKLFKREDGSYYLFTEGLFQARMEEALEAMAAYNGLAKALTKLEELEEKATDKDYFLGIVSDGCEHIRNEHRATLERELKNISFFKAKRKELIEEAVEAIPSVVFETVQLHLEKARKANENLSPRVSAEYLTVTLADDGSCLWVGLSDKFEEDLRASMTEEVTDEKIEDCKVFISAVETLRSLQDKGINLTGCWGLNGCYYPGLIENMLGTGGEKNLTIDYLASRLNRKNK